MTNLELRQKLFLRTLGAEHFLDKRACKAAGWSHWTELLRKAFGAALLLPLFALAADVKVAWSPSPTAGVTNYVLYAHTNTMAANSTNALVKASVGTNTVVTLENIQPRQWFFYVAAVKDGVRSDLSVPAIAEVPQPPTNARLVVVEYGITITNFVDTGYFRLRIQ